MIIVSGTKRSGTSLWMHVLVAAGLPLIGERFPGGWGEILRKINPDGLFESELMGGIYFRTNPHPQTGAYLAPQQTREHAVKVFIPGLVRTDVAFIDRCVATVRSWREFVRSTRRVASMQPDASPEGSEYGVLPPALEWWSHNYALVRDLAIRGYPAHVVSYDSLLRDPTRVVTEALQWIGRGDVERAAAVVDRSLRTEQGGGDTDDEDLAEGIEPEHLATFDALYQTIDEERPLTQSMVDRLNRTDEALRPRVLEHQAKADAGLVAQMAARRN